MKKNFPFALVLLSFAFGFLLSYGFFKIETIKVFSLNNLSGEKIISSNFSCEEKLSTSVNEYDLRSVKSGIFAQIRKNTELQKFEVKIEGQRVAINFRNTLVNGVVTKNDDEFLLIDFNFENQVEQTKHQFILNKNTGRAIHSSVGAVLNGTQSISGYQKNLICKNLNQ